VKAGVGSGRARLLLSPEARVAGWGIGRPRSSWAALRLAREIESAWDEAHAVAVLGRCALPADHAAEGRAGLRQALGIFNRIGATEASDMSDELEALAASAINRPTSA
jgi:hypothetical protein